MKKLPKKYYWFTLVELIIVITILAILSTIAFVSFQGYTKSSRDSVRLSNLNEEIVIGDLFVGYNGLNFFKFIGYFLFWLMIYLLIWQTIILPFLWVLATLFIAPLMFFLDKRIFEALSINFKALKMFFVEIFAILKLKIFQNTIF